MSTYIEENENYVRRMFEMSEYPLFGKYQVRMFNHMWYGDSIQSLVSAINDYQESKYEKALQVKK